MNWKDSLQEKGFIRVHRSYLVNYAWILQIKGDQVYLKNCQDKIPLSRGRSEKVKLQYQRLIREEGVLWIWQLYRNSCSYRGMYDRYTNADPIL